MNNTMRIAGVGGILVLVMAAVATLAWAEGESETYYACVNNSSGTIKVWTDPQECGQNEIAIDWSNLGPAGPPGPPGESWADARVTVYSWYFHIPAGSTKGWQLFCPTSGTLLSTGFNNYDNVTIFRDYPRYENSQVVFFRNDDNYGKNVGQVCGFL